MHAEYLEVAKLLVRISPHVFAEKGFALKGGTAINLFVQPMPRLSVDLDLVYLDHRSTREEALDNIRAALASTMTRLKRLGYLVDRVANDGADIEHKLLVRSGALNVKVEVNTVMRGTLYPPEIRALGAAAREHLGAEVALPIVSFADLYAGKLVAAMDRQHPRDLFDVSVLLNADGIAEKVRRAFVIYLACHNRPVHEVLFPREKDIRLEYQSAFAGMTTTPVPLDELEEARTRLFSELPSQLDQSERQFLLDLVAAKPLSQTLGFEHLEQLPALRWKQQNLQRLATQNRRKFNAQRDALRERLSGTLSG